MRVCILADSPFLPTGYSNQAKLLAKYLRKNGHEVMWLAVAYNGTDISYSQLPDGTTFDFLIKGEMQHSYFMNVIERHLKEWKADILIIILDTFMLYPHILSKDLSPAKTIFWAPSDGGAGMPKGCDMVLRKMDQAVMYSKFSKQQVKDYYGLDLPFIPLGTEPDRFYPLSQEKKELIRAKYGLNGKFVVGVVARNQPRKFLDRTFKAFKLLKNKIPNAVLFMHSDPTDPAQAFSMIELIKDYNLENRVCFSGMNAHKGFDWNQMNEVYNVMDCFLLTTSGEGWGIPLIEAMSCEIPVLATDYTTTPEIIKENNAGLSINLSGVAEVSTEEFFKDQKAYDEKCMNGTIMGSWMVERGIMDINDCVKKIEWIYRNPQLAREMGKDGRIAVLNKYDFNKHTAKPFEDLMKKLCQI